MAGTNFKNGVLSRGIPAEAGGQELLVADGASVFWVDSAHARASNNNDGSSAHPLATLAGAHALATASKGDIIILAPTHAETWASAAASATLSKAGLRIVPIAVGSLAPTITLGHVDATLTISGANIAVLAGPLGRLVITPSVDSVVSAVTVSGADASVEFEARDASAAIEFVRALLTSAGADRLRARILHHGFTAGNAMVNLVRLVGCNDGDIEFDTYGVHSTAVVEFSGTACSNIKIRGRLYNSGTTDGSKTVVDTIGGSTWDAEVFDAAAGASFSGSSGAALAKDDMTAITDALYGTAGIASWAAGAAPANGVSLAEAVRYISDALAGTVGLAAFPAAAAPANDVSLAEVLRDIWDGVRNGTGGTEPGANKSILDALGFDGVAAIAASAGMLRTMSGTTFVVSKTVAASAIVAAGVDLTAVSTVGAILIEDVIVQNAGTAMTSAGGNAVLNIKTDNVAGSAAFITAAQAKLGANVVVQGATHTTNNKVVLETGKKIIATATTEDFTSAGNVTFHIICRRLADNATLAAA